MASHSPRGRTSRPRRPRRKKKANQPRRRITFEGLLLGALLVYAAHQTRYLLFEASYFKLQKVEVVGLDRLSEKTVLRHSGLELGMPAFRIDPEQVAARIGRNPKIARCRVEQPSPNTLRIDLQEKPEVARIVLDGTIHEVGPDGEIMVEAGFDSSTPLLLDATVEDGPPRQLEDRHRQRLRTWLPILRDGPTRDFTRMRFGGGGRLDITWRGVRLVVDDPERFRKHVSFLGPVLADARDRGLGFEYIDLRFQDVVARYQPLENVAPPSPPAGLPRIARAPDELESFLGAAAQAYRGEEGEAPRPAAEPAAPDPVATALASRNEARREAVSAGELDPAELVVSSVRQAARASQGGEERPPPVAPQAPGGFAGAPPPGFASQGTGILARPGGGSSSRLARARPAP